MTIPATIALSLLFGASIAYGARVQIRTLQRHVFTTRYFGALMMLELILVLPLGVYFHMFYPDWSWMYLVDTADLNAGVALMIFIACPLVAAMGYLVGYYAARSASNWITLLFIGITALGLLALVIAAKDQILWIGTYEQYHRNVGLRFIASTSVMPSLILSVSGLAVSFGYTFFRFVKEGKIASQG